MDSWRSAFALDPAVVFLNHGSYGACPVAVLDAQAALRAELERQPVLFFRGLKRRIDDARAAVAAFVGADVDDLVFVRNATSGVNAVLGSLALKPGDELLVTDHGYGACLNAAEHVAKRAGARVVVAKVPFPVAGPEAVVEAVLAAVTGRTVFALIDHVTSPTGLVFPVEILARELSARGVLVMIDGAHGPGQVDLDLGALGEAGVGYYAANFHKWTCAPKGSGCLWARRDLHQVHSGLHPAVISHGYRARPGVNRLHEEFDWCGTDDPTPWLVTPTAIAVVGAMHPCGWAGVRKDHHALVVAARRRLCEVIGVAEPAPEAMLGSLATVPLPGPFGGTAFDSDPLQEALWQRHRIEVPVFGLASGGRALRVSAHRHNEAADYERLAQALAEVL